MKRPGAPRPDAVCAEIFLARMSHITKEDDSPNTMGYWVNLNHYGPVCWDSLNMLKRHISQAAYDRIHAILTADDARANAEE